MSDDATGSGTFTYPTGAAPTDAAYFGLMLSETTVGKFATAAAFTVPPPSITAGPSEEPSSQLTVPKSLAVPTSGLWDFSMNIGTAFLSGTNCPSGSSSSTTGGPATFELSCDGYTADLHLDDSHVAFQLQSTATGTYQSPEYTFPVVSGDSTVAGTNHYEFTSTSSASNVTGALHWDNMLGCTAEYPFTMSLTSATSAVVNTLCAGTWTMLYGSAVVCGATPIELGALAFGPQALGTVSTLDSPSGVPLAMTFDTSGGDVFLVRQGCTNTYGNVFAPLAFGVIPDATGMPLILNLSFQAYAVTSQLMTGVGILTGAGPATSCSTVFTYTLTALGPC